MLPLLPGSMTTLWFTPKNAQLWQGTPRVSSSDSSISRVSWLSMWQRWKKSFNFNTPSPISPREPSSSPKSRYFPTTEESQLEGTGEWWKINSTSSARYSFQFCSPFAFLLVLITLVFNHPGYCVVVHQPKGDLGFNQCRKPLLLCSWAFVKKCNLQSWTILMFDLKFVLFDFFFLLFIAWCSFAFAVVSGVIPLILSLFYFLNITWFSFSWCFNDYLFVLVIFSFKDSFRSKQNGKE